MFAVITKLSLYNRVIVLSFMALVLVMGVMNYFALPRAEDPGFIFRVAKIVTYFPGASPERVENLVTAVLEKSIQEMPEVDYIVSESRSGVSILTVFLQEGIPDIQPLWEVMRRKISKAQPDLPQGILGPFVNDEFGDVYGTILAITGDGLSWKSLKGVAEKVRDRLLLLDDVAKVDYYGAQEERVFVEYSDARLAEQGASSLMLKQLLEERNILLPGGSVVTDKERILVEPSGNFETLEDLRNVVVNVPGTKEVLYLKDFVDVYRGYRDPPQAKLYYSGQPALALAISMRKNGNIIALGEQLRALEEELNRTYPVGVQFHWAVFQADFVASKVDNFVGNFMQSCAIVVGMMLFSLGLRTGLVVGSLVPMTILASFMAMPFFNLGIDQITLAGLIISLGLLVDNAIVMSESIMTEVKGGLSPVEAAIESSRQLGVGLLTSSLTTIFAFLPVYLASSLAGEYTTPLFKVVAITLLFSWFFTITVIPLVCITFLQFSYTSKEQEESPLLRRYRSVIVYVLRHPWQTVSLFVAVFAVALYLFQFVPQSFFPPSDRPLFTIDVELPAGTKVEYSDAVARQIDAYLQGWTAAQRGADAPHLVSWLTFVGGQAPLFVLTYSPRESSPRRLFLLVTTNDVTTQPALMHEIEAHLQELFPQARFSVKPIQTGPFVAAPVEVRLSGYDAKVLRAIAEEVKERLRLIPEAKNIRDDWGGEVKKMQVRVNAANALRAGVTNRDIALSLQTSLDGFDATQFREGDSIIPVTLRSAEAERRDLDKLESLIVHSQSSAKAVPLKQVADLALVWENDTIMHRDTLKTITVQADVTEGVYPYTVTDALGPWLDEQQRRWPAGYFYRFGGELETSTKSSVSINQKMPIAIFLIMFLLICQFNSLRNPIIIMLTVPLGLIGVVIGLLVTQSYLGFMTLLGIVSLAGIVVNNAIILIERFQQEMADYGKKPTHAIVDSTVRRLRPIMLTTATTIGGLLTLWFGSSAMFVPMAIAIIWGLVFATILTLGFVPLLYALFWGISFKDYKPR